MNPVTLGTDHSPPTMLHARFAELYYKEGEQRQEMNILGTSVDLPEDNELRAVMRECGIVKINHPATVRTFEEFRQMGCARYDIVLNEHGVRAAELLAPRIPYAYVPPLYDAKGIAGQYKAIFDMIGCRADISEYEEGLRETVAETAAFMGDRSIGIGGSQTGIYPLDSPGGWNIIAKTPVKLYDPLSENPTLLKAGDRVKFIPVTEEDYNLIHKMVEEGTYHPVIRQGGVL